jgi:hypothetical protein
MGEVVAHVDWVAAGQREDPLPGFYIAGGVSRMPAGVASGSLHLCRQDAFIVFYICLQMAITTCWIGFFLLEVFYQLLERLRFFSLIILNMCKIHLT